MKPLASASRRTARCRSVRGGRHARQVVSESRAGWSVRVARARQRHQRAGDALRRKHRGGEGQQQHFEIDRRQLSVKAVTPAMVARLSSVAIDRKSSTWRRLARAQVRENPRPSGRGRPWRRSACRRRGAGSARPGRSRSRTCRRSGAGSRPAPWRRVGRRAPARCLSQ